MAARVFGPIRGAGTQVEEREGQKPIEPGLLGWAGYAGILERGPVYPELMVISSEKQLIKKTGGIISDSTLPDACQDYFDNANGAGGLLLVRITDGDELPASMPVYGRRNPRIQVGTIEAKNGGRWAGKEKSLSGTLSGAGDLTATTMTTGVTMKVSEWKGGYIELDGVPNKRYKVTGNTTAGVVTVEGDNTMAADLAGGGDSSNLLWYLHLDRDAKGLSIEFRDGEENPDTEFGMFVYLDDALSDVYYPNLSMDTASARYWVDIVNKDGNNDLIKVTDSWTGGRDATVRPANLYGVISAITATLLTATIHELVVTSSPTNANPTATLGATTETHKRQSLVITMTSPTAFNVVSSIFGLVGTGTVGVAFTSTNNYVPPFTIVQGATVLATGDILTLHYKPFPPSNGLVGGYVFPDKVNNKRTKYRITANTRSTITVADGSDMVTGGGAISDLWLVQAPINLTGGRDGNAGVVDATYVSKAWDLSNSPFNKIAGRGFGLVKLATPGITSTTVQQAGRNYAASKNHQYRYEAPSNVTTEDGVEALVNDTLGRSDYAVISFPSYADVPDPLGGGQGKLKRISQTGAIHGREARIANDYFGYHKAQAGIDAILPRIQDLPTGENVLNEEFLNPKGIGVIKKVKGNFVIWGDRTVHTDPAWKFKHHREMMSYYEQVLMESFDWIIFGLNSEGGRKQVLSSMLSFFRPEYRKGALDNDYAFKDACVIKIDKENNTALTKADGDMFCDIELRLVDVVERLRIRISKAGIFEL